MYARKFGHHGQLPAAEELVVLAPRRDGQPRMNGAAYRWLRRLSRFATFTPDEQCALEEACASSRRYAIGEELQKIGDPGDRLFVLLEGLACRHKLLPDGRRQILAYLFAGDMGDPRQLVQSHADHAMCILWPSEVAVLTQSVVQRIEHHPEISVALARYQLSQQAIGREWLVNVGHRTAFERLGHLVCEIFVRLDAVGLTREHAFELPLTQAELGDTLALSAVHVNRTLMEMRRLKLMTFQNRQVVIHDLSALQAAAGFDSGYLTINESH
jgi:CRP-like cAMP-binding protein